MDKIFFYGMTFYAYHGAFPEENCLGQRFIVDLELFLSLHQAARTDELNHTINYAEVYKLVEQEVTQKRVKLIETLAENIAASLLQRFSELAQVKVRVMKPHPPIPGHYQSVGVEITRGRNES